MRALHLLVLLGVGLLLGFTFYEDVPGKRPEMLLRQAAAEAASTDLVRDAYQAAQRVIQDRVGNHRPAEFPTRASYRAQVQRQADGTFVINSWVNARASTQLRTKSPWTAHVDCGRGYCEVLSYELKR